MYRIKDLLFARMDSPLWLWIGFNHDNHKRNLRFHIFLAENSNLPFSLCSICVPYNEYTFDICGFADGSGNEDHLKLFSQILQDIDPALRYELAQERANFIYHSVSQNEPKMNVRISDWWKAFNEDAIFNHINVKLYAIKHAISGRAIN